MCTQVDTKIYIISEYSPTEDSDSVTDAGVPNTDSGAVKSGSNAGIQRYVKTDQSCGSYNQKWRHTSTIHQIQHIAN